MSTRLIPWREILEEDLRDPAFRAEWEATALAREIANWVIKYRADHHLSQTALARRLGMTQSAVSRLEEGDHEPRIATLRKLSEVLGMRLSLSIEPPAEASSDGSRVTVAIG